jgi:hypothetical protein
MSDNRVSDVLAQAFAAEGVDTLFTLMGDANMYWSASMADNQRVRLIHARHEHCCVAMADAYAVLPVRSGSGGDMWPGLYPDHDRAGDGRAGQRAGCGVRWRCSDRRFLVHTVDRSGAAGAGDRRAFRADPDD